MPIILVAIAVVAAMFLKLRQAKPTIGLVRAKRWRRRRHARELQHAEPGRVPARGDRR
jgi:hypothetical protein